MIIKLHTPKSELLVDVSLDTAKRYYQLGKEYYSENTRIYVVEITEDYSEVWFEYKK